LLASSATNAKNGIGTVVAKRAGIVTVDAHFAIRHDCSHVHVSLEVDGKEKTMYAREYNHHTSGRWDGIAMGHSVPVETGDEITLTINVGTGCNIQDFVPEPAWGRATFLFSR